MKNFRNGTDNAVRVVRVLISKSSPGFTRYFVESLGSARARLCLGAGHCLVGGKWGREEKRIYKCGPKKSYLSYLASQSEATILTNSVLIGRGYPAYSSGDKRYV